jgi:hypothetical protein
MENWYNDIWNTYLISRRIGCILPRNKVALFGRFNLCALKGKQLQTRLNGIVQCAVLEFTTLVWRV